MHEYVVVLVSILANNLLGLNGETLGPKKVDEETDFKKLVQRGTPMVDKSLLIKEFMDDPKNTIVVARPRGFGKSINLSMMKHFLTVNGTSESLFNNLAIARDVDFCKMHQNKHPVIHLNFASLRGETLDECKRQLTISINNLYLQHHYLGQSSRLSEAERKNFTASYSGSVADTHVPLLISKLMRLMRIHYGQKIIVLLEDYDIPIWSAYSKYFQMDMYDLLRGVIENIFNDESLLKGMILGVTSEGKNIFSGLKNKGIYTVRHDKYSEYFGFLETEVKHLTTDYKISKLNILKELKDHYGGYKIGNKTIVYNSWSLTSCLKDGAKLGNNWLKSFDSPEVLNPIIMTYGVVPPLKVEMLLLGVDIRIVFEPDYSVHEELFTNEDKFWTFLVQLGFFTIIHQEKNNRSEILCDLRIPNREIRSAMVFAIKGYETKYKVARYKEFLDCFKRNDSSKAQIILDSYVKNSALFFFDHRLDRVASLFKGLESVYGPSGTITDKDDYYLLELNPGKPEPFLLLLIRAESFDDIKPAASLIKSLEKNEIIHFKLFVHFPPDKEIFDQLKHPQKEP